MDVKNQSKIAKSETEDFSIKTEDEAQAHEEELQYDVKPLPVKLEFPYSYL